jgi:hypothetical protein
VGAEAILSVVAKVALGLGTVLIAALGWSIRQILSDLRAQLVSLQGLTASHEKSLAEGSVTFRELIRRVERLEKHDEDRCKSCRLEAAGFTPAHTPVPGRG